MAVSFFKLWVCSMLAVLLHSSSPEINANAVMSLLIFCIVAVGLVVYFVALPTLFRFFEKRLNPNTAKTASEPSRRPKRKPENPNLI